LAELPTATSGSFMEARSPFYAVPGSTNGTAPHRFRPFATAKPPELTDLALNVASRFDSFR